MKKRNLALLLTAALLSMGGCAAGEETTEQNQQTVQASMETGEESTETGTKTAASGEASMEALEQHEETPAEDFIFVVSGSGDYVSIEGYHGEDNIVVIPENIEGVPVTVVSGLSGSGIAGIRFSDSVETIEDACFFEDGELMYVICGDNIKEIGEMVFYNCTNLKEIRLNEGLETLGIGALMTGSSDLTDIYIPETVTDLTGIDFYGTVTYHVKAGSPAEEFFRSVTEKNFPDLKYTIE